MLEQRLERLRRKQGQVTNLDQAEKLQLEIEKLLQLRPDSIEERRAQRKEEVRSYIMDKFGC